MFGLPEVKITNRHLSILGGVIVVAGFAGFEIYDLIVSKKGVSYFITNYQDWLYLLIFIAVGGVVEFGVNRLPPTLEKKLRIIALWIVVVLITAIAGSIAYLVWIVNTGANSF